MEGFREAGFLNFLQLFPKELKHLLVLGEEEVPSADQLCGLLETETGDPNGPRTMDMLKHYIRHLDSESMESCYFCIIYVECACM